jgi:hypothetical protein
MLAQNFKTAEDLRITDTELESLIKVLGMLERDEFTHYPFYNNISVFKIKEIIARGFQPEGKKYLQMRGFLSDEGCGTAGCICGWAHLISNGKAFPELTIHGGVISLANRLSVEASELFLINGPFTAYQRESVKPDQAAAALRNFLTTGHHQWSLT